MAEPLTSEERLHLFSPRVREFGKASWVDVERYEATVQAEEAGRKAAEERADALRAAMESVEVYAGGEPELHRTFGDACGEDACMVCLIEGTASQALADDEAKRGEA